MSRSYKPPKLASRLLNWILRDDLAEEVQGDLEEKFYSQLERNSHFKAKVNYWWQVFQYIRPFAIRRSFTNPLKNLTMIKNYVKIGLRRLKRNKVYSILNIGGLSIGLAVVMLIGIWIQKELTYDDWHPHPDRVAVVLQFKNRNGQKIVAHPLPFPLGDELREQYGDDFETVVMSSWTWDHVMGHEGNNIIKYGAFMEPGASLLLDLQMIDGDRNSLQDQHSVLINESTAKAMFGNSDPIGKPLKLDNSLNVLVAGVYKDMPASFRDLEFIAPWDLYVASNEWIQESRSEWDNSAFTAYVKLKDGVSLDDVNQRIKPAISQNYPEEWRESAQIEVFLQPMSEWHLRSNWENGVQTGGPIQNIWLFGGIGLFVLLLACINFMNLSTAQSLKRSREVGIRKAIGSLKKQLVHQFMTESFLMVVFSYLVALLLVWASLPYFQIVANKRMSIPVSEPWFWMAGIAIVFITGLLAGSYPSFHLSGFQAVKALKGTLRQGALSGALRKGLVVVQFVISVILIIGTLVVKDQVDYSLSRPMGYDAKNLISVDILSEDYEGKFDILDAQLKELRAISSMALVSSPMTSVNSTISGFKWEGKDPELDVHMAMVWANEDLGKTIGWEVVQGRDFSRDLATDSAAFVVNESAVRLMGLEDPVGQSITLGDDGTFKIIGVIKDIVRESPYKEIRPAVYMMNPGEEELEYFLLKLNPDISSQEAIASVESVFTQIAPDIPFDFSFVDEAYGRKFRQEQRVSKLSGIFAVLAIIISCLGLFGLASYMAEQRTKEIGIRKVLGASITNLWKMLSWEFVLLILLASGIAIPLAYYFISGWLNNYQYRIDLPWLSFLVAIVGALVITLITVSFQSIKAALANPVKSLRSE